MQNVKSQLAMMALMMFSRHPQVSPVGPANPQRKPERIKGLQSCGPVHSRRQIGRNYPCLCGRVNESSLEWRLVDGELKKLPRPMKFKDCCHAAARESRRSSQVRGRQIVSRRMQATLDAQCN